MTVDPRPPGLSAARRSIDAVARELGLAGNDSVDLRIAVGEAISNAFDHGGACRDREKIRVSWEFDDEVLTVTVLDQGLGFGADWREPEPCGGLAFPRRGIELMRYCADEVHFCSKNGGKVVLRKRRRRDILSACSANQPAQD